MSNCPCCNHPDIDKIDNAVRNKITTKKEAASLLNVSNYIYKQHWKKHQPLNLTPVIIDPSTYTDRKLVWMNNSVLISMNDQYKKIVKYFSFKSQTMTEEDQIAYYLNIILPLIERMTNIKEKIGKTNKLINNTNVEEKGIKELIIKWVGESRKNE